MHKFRIISCFILLTTSQLLVAQFRGQQPKDKKLDPIVEQFVEEAMNHSQLEDMAFELLDVIGPRLVGSSAMEQANDWTIQKFNTWGIAAEKQQFGQWDAWDRGITEAVMTYPRIKTLEAIQLAWCPSTPKPVEAEVVTLPEIKDKEAFEAWLKTIKGKMVLIDQYQRWGRGDYQIKEFATPEAYEKIKEQRVRDTDAYNELIKNTGYTKKELPEILEKAGAVGIISSYWTGIQGANRIFGTTTQTIPTIDLAMEDYGMLFRLATKGKKPRIKVNTQSTKQGKRKSFNTIATIPGKEKPNEYVVLSAHLDSWDGGQGATDNGTGVLTMMEAARILKKYYLNNKRTIIIGLWGSEEQGLNGSRGFVMDNPQITKNIQVAFNQDNGTGRIANVAGQGFLHAYDYIGRWLEALPSEQRRHIETSFPGMPSGGGSDNASFTAAGVPGISLSSLNWGYFGYTWHTQRDTYDKIMFDEVINNVIVTTVMAYMASEEPEMVSREKRVLPEGSTWPEMREPKRDGN
ncbi:MAG: M20/M25/M40 family metallo-hydrolase [Chitinophagales bacterium]|nr:M20/M25/M40 family metallo-hydrolase [Chitinophagales bacterium]